LSPQGIKPIFVHPPVWAKGMANTQWILAPVIEGGLVNHNLELIVLEFCARNWNMATE